MARPRKDLEKAFSLVAKDLIANGKDISDVGIILGALGEDSLKWLKDLKAECSTIDEFIEIAKQRADIALIVAAVKTALGYEYQEIDQNFLRVPVGYDESGKPLMREVPSNKKVKTKRVLPNEALLRFLLRCRLPEYFSDVRKVEINKKVIEIKGDAEKQIRELSQSLLESLENKEADG